MLALLSLRALELTEQCLDSGSADLWVVSETCNTEQCDSASQSLPKYPQSNLHSTGEAFRIQYGNSETGTYAFGLIGEDEVTLAGSAVQQQYFGSVEDTNTSVLQAGSVGIFGIGFPINR